MKIFNVRIPKEVYGPIIIILSTIIIEKIIKFIIKKIFNPNKKHSKLDARKALTIQSLLCNLVRYLLWIAAVFSILGVFGINTAAIVTGLGVVSLVIGLAFQDMLKDILAGVSILFENWFAVGDFVKIGDFTGTVTSVGLKSTKVQAYTGEIKIISNRNISEVINYSLDKTLAVVDMAVSYESNLDEVEKVLKMACTQLNEDYDLLVEEPEVLGVQSLDDSAVVFRVIGKCKPAKHLIVERYMKKELKKALDKNKIKIPYPQIEVHHEK